jgi:hypothetical protein
LLHNQSTPQELASKHSAIFKKRCFLSEYQSVNKLIADVGADIEFYSHVRFQQIFKIT